MLLPTKVKKIITVALVSVFLFSFPAVVIAQETNNTTPPPETKTPNQQYYLIPIPDPGEDQKVVPIPIPEGDPQIEQAFLHNKLFDFFTDVVGGIISIPVAIFNCVADPLNCAAGGLYGFFKFGMTVVETFILEQIGGRTSVEAVAVVGSGDPVAINKFYEKVINEKNPAAFGLVGVVGSATPSLLALPIPVDSSQYLASINPFTPASAAIGDGFGELTDSNSIILKIWTKVRDVAYVLSVAVLVIIGFMIMLRIPIGPRNVITLQNSLPKIALSLLLITFSFTISGIMIDLARMAAGVVGELVSIPLEAGVAMAIIFLIVPIIAGVLFFSGGSAAPLVVGLLVVVLLLALIMAIIVLIVFFIVAYKLVTRYVIFLLMTIFAPLFFLVGALPKGEGAIIYWFKRTGAALIAIPATGLVINLSFAIGFSGLGGGPGTLEIPDLGLMGGPIGVAFAWAFLSPIVGLALFFYASKVPDTVDEMFGVKGGGGRGGGGIIGGIVGAPLGAMRTLGTVNRAAPTLAGWASGTVGTGGLRGKIAEGVYGLSKPFAGGHGEKLPSVKELKVGRAVERIARVGATATKKDVISSVDQTAPKGSTGPKETFGEGSTRFTPDRRAQQTQLEKNLKDNIGNLGGGNDTRGQDDSKG